MIKGETVTLVVKTATGTNPFGETTYSTINENVVDVLVELLSAEELVADMEYFGKKTMYKLHIPIGDTHTWEDTEVIVRGKTYKTIGPLVEYPQNMVPLRWNKQIKVCFYE